MTTAESTLATVFQVYERLLNEGAAKKQVIAALMVELRVSRPEAEKYFTRAKRHFDEET